MLSHRGAPIEAIERVYRSHFERFFNVARGVVRDNEVAADVVQDAFARAICHRSSFRGTGSLERWLWKTVLHTASTHAAVERRHAAISACGLAVDGHASSAGTTHARVRSAVAALPERQRLALFLRYYGDLDYQRIAETLEVSLGTVGAMLNAAHRKLRTTLEEDRDGTV